MDVFTQAHSCPKTEAAISLTHVYRMVHQQGDGKQAQSEKEVLGEFEDAWDPGIQTTLDNASDTEIYVEQEPLKFDIADIQLEKHLGEGTYGKAFTCMVKGRALVVKMHPDQSTRATNMKRPLDADDVPQMISTERLSSRGLADTMEAYEMEMDNFEKMMEPPSVREARVQNKDRWVHFKMDNADVNRRHYKALQADMKMLQSLKGYKHMHKLLHMEVIDKVPLIFSERCDDSLHRLLRQYARTNCYELRPTFINNMFYPTSLWISIAQQLSDAMNYMLSVGYVNVDIKPANILYVVEGGSMVFKMSDYGMCEPKHTKESDDNMVGYARGTPYFSPPKDMQEELTSEQISIYQLACTLISIVDYNHPDIKPEFVGTTYTQNNVTEYLYPEDKDPKKRSKICVLMRALDGYMPPRIFHILSGMVRKRNKVSRYEDLLIHFQDFKTRIDAAS